MHEDPLFAAAICSYLLFCALDLLTLFLYWNKLRVVMNKFEDSNDKHVHDNLRMILRRIIIMTTFYIVVVVALMYSYSLASITRAAYSMAMYLMLDHNTKEYYVFLKYVHHCFAFGHSPRSHYEFGSRGAVAKRRRSENQTSGPPVDVFFRR